MHTSTRRLLIAGLGLVVALAAGCAADQPPASSQTSQSATIPASADTTRTTGIATWEVYALPGGVQTLGLAADGTVRTAVEIDRIDDQTVSLRAVGDHPGELRFTRSGRVLIDTLPTDDGTVAALGAMARDVKDVQVQYGWLACIGASLAAGGACGAAGAQLGLDVPNDAVCVGAEMLAIDACDF